MFTSKASGLLLEDSADVARALARIMAAHGFAVTAVRLCAEALALAGVFQLGVFDIDLPDGSGVDVARTLLARGQVRRVIFCTGCASFQTLRAAEELGQVVSKPDAGTALSVLLKTEHQTPLVRA